MKKFLGTGLLLLCGIWGSAAEIVNKGNIFVLNNSRLTVEISPSQGGRVIRFYDKKNKTELTQAPQKSQMVGDAGLFLDRVWPLRGDQARHYEKTAYKVVSFKADKTTAELKLLCQSRPLDIEKTYILNENERTLRVRYALSNPAETPFTGRFWSNCTPVPEGNVYKLRFPKGYYGNDMRKSGPVQSPVFSYNKTAPRGGNHWSIEPQKDYCSISGFRSGAVLTAPFEFLEYFYACLSSQKGVNPTLEWMSSQLHIKPLSVGKADAGNHPELEDPLQDYIVRFETSLTAVDKFDFDSFRPVPRIGKNTKFRQVLSTAGTHSDFPYPAVPWYTYQKECPRVLIFSDYIDSAQAFDFFRRFRCRPEVAEGWRGGILIKNCQYNGYIVPDTEKFAVKALQSKPELIILPNMQNSTFPANIKKLLIQRIREGAVAISITDKNRFTDLFKDKGTVVPAEVFRGIPINVKVTEHRIGRGKVYMVPFRLYLNYRPWSQPWLLLPAPDPELAEPEPYYAFYGRLFRYALGYKSPAQIISTAVRGSRIEAVISSTQTASAEINGKKITLKKGSNKVSFPFVREKLNGKYKVPVLLKVNGFSSDVFYACYEVKNVPRILKFAPAKYAHESGDRFTGSLELAGKGDVRILLKDAADRVLGLFEKKKASGRINFSIKPQMDGINAFCVLEAELRSAGKLVEKRRSNVSRRTPDNSKLRFILWHSSYSTPSGRIRNQKAVEMGFTHLMSSQVTALGTIDAKFGAEAIQQEGARYIVNTLYRFVDRNMVRLGYGNLSKGKVKFRTPCLHDPAEIVKIRKYVRDIAQKHTANFPASYYSADENCLGLHDSPHDLCFTEHTLKVFRKAMQKKYGSLAKLNRIWKTSFRSWDKVVPLTFDEAQKKGNFASYLAHRIFMLTALDTGMAELKAELLSLDPQARMGHSGQGLTHIEDCWDWRVMPRHYDQSSIYARDGGLPDLLRTRDPAYLAGNWNGYGMALPQIRFYSWNDITDGMFAPSYWTHLYFFRRGDNQLNEAGKHMKGVISEIKKAGTDPLMTEGKRIRSPFTLVYSPDALVASAATGAASRMSDMVYTRNFVGWTILIRSAGFPAPQAIGDHKIFDITPANTPCLVLPMLQLMSDAQVAHVEKYVRGGGTLVIDARAGVYNDLYSLRKNNPLMALAGVREKGLQKDVEGNLRFGDTPVAFGVTGSEIAAAGARPFGSASISTPAGVFWGIKFGSVKRPVSDAFLIRNVGKGKVVYLNALCDTVDKVLPDPLTGRIMLSAFRDFFKKINILPAASAACNVNHSEYVNGPFRVFTVTRRGGSGTERFTHPLGGEWHLYDTMKHKYIGKRSKVSFDLNAWDIKSCIAVKEKIGKPAISLVRQKNGFTLKSAGNSGVWYVEIFRGKEPVKGLTRNVILNKSDSAFFALGIAPAGKFSIKALNIMTGQKLNWEISYK